MSKEGNAGNADRNADRNADLPIGIKQEANREIGAPRTAAPVWHREYWDRFIRNERHFQQAVEYIHQNPVKAGLVERPEQWPWSSASIMEKREDGGPAF